jgi:hypothetical protein
MTFRRAFAFSFSVALTLPLGCAKGGGSNAASSSSSSSSASGPVAQASAPSLPSGTPRPEARPRGRSLSGPVGTLFRAARDLPLTDAQKASLDALETQLATPATGEPPHDDAKALQTDIVAGIRAGKLDQAKLRADFAASDKAMAAHEAKEESALSGLYAALDPAERKALVAAVRTKETARDAQFAAHGVDMDAGAAEWAKRRLDRMTAQLGLDAAQQKTVGALLVKGDSMGPAAMNTQREEGKKRMERILSSFEGDTFDPKKLDLGGVPGTTLHEGLEKDTAFLSQLVPVLTPEQREKLATQRDRPGLRRHPDDGHFNGPGAAGGGAAIE